MSIEEFLAQRGIQYEKHRHATAYTAQSLAHAEHVSGYMVAKPVIVKADDGFAMCVLAAPKHVDLHRIADLLDDEGVRLATEAEMANLFPECDLGAEPPIGAYFGLRTIMDEQLQEDAFVVMQAGSHHESFRIRRDDWQRLCDPIVAPIATA